MDKYERMIIRAAVEWREILRTRGVKLCCPGCGETRPYGFEVHHIAGIKAGEEALPLCIACHRQLSAWQATEHPPILEETPTQQQKWGHFLIGRADTIDMEAELLRVIGDYLIEEGTPKGLPPKR